MPYNLLGLIVFAIIASILIHFIEDARLQKLFYVVVFIVCLLGLLGFFVPGFEVIRFR